MTRVLIIGGAGQLGAELLRLTWPAGVELVAPTRAELDLTDAAAVRDVVRGRGISAIVNAAAYTAVDAAETDAAAAFAANALGPAILADAARAAGAALVHVSTDYVFDGTASDPYEVDHPIAPLGVYGASKAAGEYAVLLGAPRSAVVRTAWVVSARRSNFLTTMLRLGREREAVRVVADQQGAPTLAADLAAALATIALRIIDDETAPTGLFHFTNSGPTTWHDFAAAIFAAASERGAKTPRLEAITTADYPTPARRPAFSVLSTRRIEEAYGLAPRPWAEGLPRLIDEALESAT